MRTIHWRLWAYSLVQSPGHLLIWQPQFPILILSHISIFHWKPRCQLCRQSGTRVCRNDKLRGQLRQPFQCRHNGRDGVSNHQPRDCLLNHLLNRWPVNSLHKSPATRKMFPFDDAIMKSGIMMTFSSQCLLYWLVNRAQSKSVLSIQRNWRNDTNFNSFGRNINKYLQFLSFLHIDMTQVIEILPRVRQGPTLFA